VHLRYPTRHRRRWGSTNLLERSLAEVERRTKVIRFLGETSCLTLVWAVLDLYFTHAKNGVKFNQLERQRLATAARKSPRGTHGGHKCQNRRGSLGSVGVGPRKGISCEPPANWPTSA
jgi:hypothetical protein